MKRVLRILILLLPLWGTGPNVAAAEQAQPFRLLMVLWRGETAAESGFLEELRRHRFEVAVDRINAHQNREILARHLWQLGGDISNYDAVYSFGTTASVMTQSVVRGRIPQLFSMVSDPVEAGLSRTAQDSRSGVQPITGTTDAISAALRIRTAQQLFPIGHMGMLFNPRERNARVQLEEVEQLCEKLGIKLTILRVAPDSTSLANQLQRLRETATDIDTLYLPSDSYLISQSQTIMAALADSDYRVVGATETFVRDGALLAIAPDYPTMGRQLARRLIAIHQGSSAVMSLPPLGVDQPRILYNETTRARLGIEIPTALQGQLTAVAE